MDNLVSIIIPTFNRGHIIHETLDSVLTQTYANWECIIVDDGSTDDTVLVVRKFLEDDNRFRFYHRPNNRLKGASSCRNYGFALSKGDYIQYLDSDDIISANKLEEQIKMICNEPYTSLVTCKWGWLRSDKQDKILFDKLDTYNFFSSPEAFLNALARSKGYFPINAYLINRKMIERTGDWNEHLTINDDGEFMMRLIMNATQVFYSEKSCVYYRLGNQSNLSALNSRQKCIDLLNSWKLIEALIKIRFKEKNVYYVDKIKDVLYVNFKDTYPILIQENKDFFKKQLGSDSLIVRLKKKLIFIWKLKVH